MSRRRTEQLAFARDAGWNSFLQEYVEETRRKPRGFKDGDELLSGFRQAPDHSSSSQLSWAVNDSERRANVKRRKGRRQSRPQYAQPAGYRGEEGLSECIQANPAAVASVQDFSRIGDPKLTRVSHEPDSHREPMRAFTVGDAHIVPAASSRSWLLPCALDGTIIGPQIGSREVPTGCRRCRISP